jgi:hypothetical protein
MSRIADDDRQQIVEVVRQAAGELADRFHLLRLAQLCALRLHLAPFGHVAHDADEGMVAGVRRFADRELHRKGRAVFAAAHHLATGADDLRHAGGEICRDVAIVFAMVRFRHQDADILPDDLVRGVAEQADAGLVERLDDAMPVDGDQAVHHRVQHGGDQAAELRLAGLHHGLGGDACSDVAGDFAEAMHHTVGRADGGDHHIGQEA